MGEQHRKILKMLSEKKITSEEAEKLLEALGNTEPDTSGISGTESNSFKPKFLHIKVNSAPGENGKHENVDIKIPIMLLRAGMKFGSLVPENTKGKFKASFEKHGIDLDLNNIDAKNIDHLIQALSEK